MQDAIRPPAVAGMFYPGTATALAASVRACLAEVRAPDTGRAVPKALIVPHAGYIYSGPIAAMAYARLAPVRTRLRRVVLLGPAHRFPVRGLALPAARALATPLGVVEIDRAAAQMLGTRAEVSVSEAAHAGEHALEVQLPFLQTVLDRFTVVPLIVGFASTEDVAGVLDALWGGDETVIVISSDLSHYHRYAEAQALDRATAESIVDELPTLDHGQACGATPINGLLACARRRGLVAELVDLRNSGDTAGDRSRVVGYGAFAFYPDGPRGH